LIQKIRHLGAKVRRTAAPATASPPLAPHHDKARNIVARPALAPVVQQPLSRRPFGMVAPKVLLIGSSTGGPQALMSLVADIGPVIDRFPVLITQHMPPTFTTIPPSIWRARAAVRRMRPLTARCQAGKDLSAPGGRHMRVVRHCMDVVIALDDGPPVNFCKPAVDPLFTSAIDVWQGGILSVILTGMGSDGRAGARTSSPLAAA
jgi:two-component system chemotaxis response regulator CheB